MDIYYPVFYLDHTEIKPDSTITLSYQHLILILLSGIFFDYVHQVNMCYIKQNF